jgi:hypothetical protein
VSAELRILRVTRYGCPCCPRTHATRRDALAHVGRCWVNPDNRGCKTCAHFEERMPGEIDTGYPGEEEACALGVSLAGQDAYEFCPAHTDPVNPFGSDGASGCADCRTDGKHVPPGPILHCGLWEARR